MKSEGVISFTDFANHYNGFISDYQDSFFPEPAEFMEYLFNCNGKVVVIGSRPGQGKTSLMLSLIKDSPQIPVLVFSLEMSATQLIRRFLFRPDRYGIIQDDKGNCLENLVMISGLKGKFKENSLIFQLNKGNGAFGKAEVLNIMNIQ